MDERCPNVTVWTVVFNRGLRGPLLIGVFPSKDEAVAKAPRGADIWEAEVGRSYLPPKETPSRKPELASLTLVG